MIVTLLLSKLPFRFTDKTPSTKGLKKMVSGLVDLIPLGAMLGRFMRQDPSEWRDRITCLISEGQEMDLSDSKAPVAPPTPARQLTSVISLCRKENHHMHSD